MEDAVERRRTRRRTAEEANTNRVAQRRADIPADESQVIVLNDDVPYVPLILSDNDADDEDTNDGVAIGSPSEVKKARFSQSSQQPGTSACDEEESADDSCQICFENFTSTGEHRLASLKCGHFFGAKCIERWIAMEKGKRGCPICKDTAKKKDIRLHYAATVKAVDNSEEHVLRKAVESYRSENQSLKTTIAVLEKRLLEAESAAKHSIATSAIAGGMVSTSHSSSSLRWRLQSLAYSKVNKSGEGSRCLAWNGQLLLVAVKMDNISHFNGIVQYGIALYNDVIQRRGETIPLFAKRIRVIEFSPYNAKLFIAAGEDSSFVVRNVDGSLRNRHPLPATVFTACWLPSGDIVLGLVNGRVFQMDINATRKTDITEGNGRIPIARVAYFDTVETLLVASFKTLRMFRYGRVSTVLEDVISERGKVQAVAVDEGSCRFVLTFAASPGSIHLLYEVAVDSVTNLGCALKHGEMRSSSSTFSYMWRNALFCLDRSLVSAFYEEDFRHVLFHDWSGRRNTETKKVAGKVTDIRGYVVDGEEVKVLILTEQDLHVAHLSTR